MRSGCFLMSKTEVVWKLNAKAARMLQSGQAEVTSGGIRDIKTKRIIAQAKPVMTTTFSQKELLSQVVQSTQMIQALSWVNVGLNLVNIGVSVAGFYMTLNKLNSLQGELRQFIDTYNADHQSDELEIYKNHLQKITNHLSYLQSRYTTPIFDQQDFMNHRVEIENECIETANFLDKTLSRFQAGQEDPKLACQIIFTLAPIYAQLVNEYCCQYYCLCGQRHNQFEFWLSVLDQINSEAFRFFMKKLMTFNADYAELNPQRRKDVLTVTFDGIEELKNNLLPCAETIQAVPEKTLVPVENLLQEKLWQDIRDNAEMQPAETPVEFFTHTVMRMAIDENDEEVYIPMQMMYG